jgi:hypothetical protein
VSVTDRLEATLRQNQWIAEILDHFDEIALPDAWLVAGCLAQTVWNLSVRHQAERGIKDIDIVYFDLSDISVETERSHETRLRSRFDGLPVKLDVKNEARVHLWYEAAFGYPIAPYASARDAIASFPTTATAFGVRQEHGMFECYAPFGLDDLFDLVIRPNKRQITEAIYAAKVERWRTLWPHLTFLSWADPGGLRVQKKILTSS